MAGSEWWPVVVRVPGMGHGVTSKGLGAKNGE